MGKSSGGSVVVGSCGRHGDRWLDPTYVPVACEDPTRDLCSKVSVVSLGTLQRCLALSQRTWVPMKQEIRVSDDRDGRFI